jgi:hypothetical protein
MRKSKPISWKEKRGKFFVFSESRNIKKKKEKKTTAFPYFNPQCKGL